MKEPTEAHEASAASTRTLEIIVSLLIIAFGGLVVFDSHRMGSVWGDSGPQSGYFPFYIGVIMIIASVINLVKAFAMSKEDSFVSKEEIRLVSAMFFPALAFVFAMQWLGIYVSGAILIALFMRWQGKFSWFTCIGVALGTVAVLFGMFELWFKVPLIKGPLEAAFGF